MPKVGDMNCSTYANEDPCHGEMPKAKSPSIPKKFMAVVVSLHMQIDTDTHYDVIKDVYVPAEFRRPHININTVYMEQHGHDYIRSNADLAIRSQIRSNEQLKCMCSECWGGIGEFKDFEKSH